MAPITFTTHETLGRGTAYTATTVVAGRTVTLHHYYLDNYPDVATLERTAHAEAEGRLRAYHYPEADIHAWRSA